MYLIPFLEATAEYQRLKAFRQGEIAMASLEKSMANDMARFFRHQGSILLQYLPEEFDEDDFQRAWDRTQLETYLEFRDLLLKHKRRAAYTCLRALENELSIPLEEAAKPRTIGTKISFDDFDEEAYRHIEQYAGARISQIDDSTKRDIREIIAKGFKGELQPDGTTKYKTHQQIAKEIKDKFEDFGAPVKGPSHIRNRAHLVAVTELREAGETSKQLARDKMEERGWQMLKRWMNMGDARVSDGCIENGNAGWIDSREAFPSGHQFPPRFPGCRCGTGSRVGDRKERSGLPDDRWIVTRQGDKVIVKPNPKYTNGYDIPIPDKLGNKSIIDTITQTQKSVLDTAIETAESKIRNGKTETSHFIDANGNELLVKKGTKNSVSFTSKEAKLAKDAIATHNHPGGTSFSIDDYVFAARTDVMQQRVTTIDADGNLVNYILDRPETGWMDPDDVKRLYVTESQRVKADIYRRGIFGKNSNQIYSHELWEAVMNRAAEHGKIIRYSKVIL